MEDPAPERITRSALFVDFDNVYSGLRDIDPAAAREFATNPGRWLRWFQDGMPGAGAEPETGAERRRVLIRRAYLNPKSFGHYRPYFVRSSFAVTDCPPLTSMGKTATDIHMVIDMLDALHHKTHFDEFIILSGDADFSPVLMRLRGYDRRTVVFSAGPASHAFRAACDMLISEDVFIEAALRLSAEPARQSPTAPNGTEPTDLVPLLERIGQALRQSVEDKGVLPAGSLPAIYRTFEEFRQSTNWLGYWGLRPMTEALIHYGQDMRLIESDETWYVEYQPGTESASTSTSDAGSQTPTAEQIERRDALMDVVRRMVAGSDAPVPMATAASEVIRHSPDIVDQRWLGYDSFGAMLTSVDPDDRGFEILSSPQPGYLWDPERHDPPSADDAPGSARELDPELEELANRINRLTGTPILAPEDYATLFQAISDAVGSSPFHLTTTSKTVRDLCIERGFPIARSNVSFVLKGLTYSGTRLGEDVVADAPDALAEQFTENVLRRADEAGLALTDEETERLRAWLGAQGAPAGSA